MAINATRALYIKLGEANRWAKVALDTGTLRFGFREIPHETCLAAVRTNDFSAIKNYHAERGDVARGTATRYCTEIREFYTATSDVLWISFAEGRLWWCFAHPAIELIPEEDRDAQGSRSRKTIDGWHDQDANGDKLWTNVLSGSLTTTAGYRGTICKVREFDYLVRRINGEETVATKAVRAARAQLTASLEPVIQRLHWKDFELLVELVMTQGGWRRVSATGGTQHTTDLELELPLTKERAIVQVKSRLDAGTAQIIAGELAEAAGGAQVFIAYHTGPAKLHVDHDNVSFIGPDALAEHVVDLGLTQWVMNKVG